MPLPQMNRSAGSLVLWGMGSFQIAGLPLHPLLVHLVVVLLPLAALATLLHAIWPAARRRLGVVTPLSAGAVLVLVPITTSAGSALAAAIGDNPKIALHAARAATLLPWAVALFVVAVACYAWFRFGVVGSWPNRVTLVVHVALAVAAAVVAAGSVIDVVRIGDSGARAVWAGVGS